jgi:Zn-dependent protease
MDKAFNLGRLFGIKFRLHFSWFVIFIVVTGLLVSPHYSEWGNWLIAIATSLLFFASVVAHELAHGLVGRANGIPVESITLFIFGGVAQMTKEATRPGAELRMAVSGPVSSLLIGGVFALFLVIPGLPEPIAVMVFWLALMNTMLAVFNLIPGFPLDGGRIFLSLLWYVTGSYIRASRIAMRLGQGIGYLFIIGGIVIIFRRPFELSWFEGVWIAFIGWFLENAASASYRQIRRQEALSSFVAVEAIPSYRSSVSLDVDVD